MRIDARGLILDSLPKEGYLGVVPGRLLQKESPSPIGKGLRGYGLRAITRRR